MMLVKKKRRIVRFVSYGVVSRATCVDSRLHRVETRQKEIAQFNQRNKFYLICIRFVGLVLMIMNELSAGNTKPPLQKKSSPLQNTMQNHANFLKVVSAVSQIKYLLENSQPLVYYPLINALEYFACGASNVQKKKKKKKTEGFSSGSGSSPTKNAIYRFAILFATRTQFFSPQFCADNRERERERERERDPAFHFAPLNHDTSRRKRMHGLKNEI